MNAETLIRKVQECPDKPQLYRQPLKEYLNSHCSNTQNIWVYDSHLGRKRLMRVPCGVCWHCKETKKNEWVTRCYAHAKDFKNVYFVTLTYRSLKPDVQEGSAAWLLRDYLKYALWHLDDHNSTGAMCWSPTVICQDHFQKFMMRLRKNTGYTDITYLASYEYGKRFGRPHAHFILFTNHDLTKKDIYSAWSISISFKNRVYTLKTNNKGFSHKLTFGNVDFHNLTTNGTFNEAQKVKVDNNTMSASNCFKYVCKYMFKDNYQDNRVKLAYDALYYGNNSHAAWLYRSKLYHREQMESALFDRSFIDVERSYIRQTKIENSDPDEQLSSSNLYTQNIKLYEKQYSVVKDPVTGCSEKIYSGLYRFTFAAMYPLFREQFRPMFRMSRGTPIGSLYVKNHIDQLSEGVNCCPTPKDVSCVVPSYFRRKVSEYIYGLRCTNEASSGLSFNKSCLPLIQQDLSAMVNGDSVHFMHIYSGSVPFGNRQFLSDLVKTNYAYKDGVNRYIIFRVAGEYEVHSFTYNRSSRLYDHVCKYDFLNWCNTYLECLHRSYIVHDKLLNLSTHNYELFDRVVKLIDEKSPISFADLRDSIETDFLHDSAQMQERYDLTHSDPVDS